MQHPQLPRALASGQLLSYLAAQPTQPFLRPEGVLDCEARELGAIAGAPPCQDQAAPVGQEDANATVRCCTRWCNTRAAC
jgi:hypothetical protein